MEQRIKGTTGLLALIGSPVGHSGSPAMYNFSFQYHNLDYAYMAFDIKEDQVPAALDAMRLFKMRGCNVTMPCKNKVAQCVDELSPAAKIIGAVNTIVNEDGKLVGHITDGIGFVLNLKEHGVDVKGKKMVVLGAGGAATALTVQCALDGAASIAIFNPDDPFLERAKGTAEKLAKEVPDCKVSVYCLDDQDKLREEIANADILANGTLAGMKPHDDLTLVDKSMFHKDLVVADCVYNPAETRMVKEAKELGLDPETAVRLFAETMKGSAEMILSSDTSLEDLEKALRLPGGATVTALEKIESMGFDAMYHEFVKVSVEHCRELGNQK